MKTPIERYLLTSESKSVMLLLWLLRNRDKDNILNFSLEEIAKECDISKVTVNKTLQKLYSADFLVKLRNGKYRLQNV